MSAILWCHLCSPPSSMECDEQQLTDAKHIQHLRIKHLGEYKPYKCNHCQEQFAVRRSLKGHAVRKHNDQSAQVETSNESKYLEVLGQVLMQCNLNASHGQEESIVQLANSIQNLTIPTCPAQPANSSIHQASREKLQKGRVKYWCEFCGNSFKLFRLLRTHQDSLHNLVSEGAHKCDRCQKRFHYRCHLIRHQRRSHVNEKRPAPKNCVYECLSCKAQFRWGVPTHLATFHIRKGVVKCSKCNQTDFWRVGNIRRHINNVHNGDGLVIDERQSIAQQIEHLANTIIKKTDRTPYRPKANKYYKASD